MNDVTAELDPMKDVLKIDSARVRGHLDQIVRQSVEDTLNGLLDAEAQALCQAERYERSAINRFLRRSHDSMQLTTYSLHRIMQILRLNLKTETGPWLKPLRVI